MNHAKSDALMARARDVILPVIGFDRPVIESGAGSWVVDVDGNRILDLNGGQFCSVLGHSNPELAVTLADITTTIQHTNTSTISAQTIEALTAVRGVMPELNPQSILLGTGSEAVEFALRYAKHITKRNELVCFDIGYHGLTLGSQSITYGGAFAAPPIFGIYAIETPRNLGASEDETAEILDQLASFLRTERVAAVVVEPIVSVGGMYVQSPSFLAAIRNLCHQHGTLLIFDECQTGLGRTGHWFGYQSVGVAPDIVVTAKGLGLGYPVALVAVADRWVDQERPLIHYSSHQNDPFAAGIVTFAIDYINRYHILSQVTAKGQYFFGRLAQLSQTNSLYGPPRGAGLMLGCDLQISDVTNYRSISADLRRYLLEECSLMIQATNGGQTLRFLPSYEITTDEIDIVVDTLDQAVNSDPRLRDR